MQLTNISAPLQSNTSITSPNITSSTTNSQVNYEVGQRVDGTITDLKNSQITITLEDGSTINGRLASSSIHAIGDNVSLTVIDFSQKSLVLKFVEQTVADYSQATIDKALEAASLTKNEKNQTLIKSLLSHQMSIDKNTIQTLLRQMSMHKNVDLNTLILMNKYNIPVTSDSISNFLKSINMEHNIFQDMNQFVDESMDRIIMLLDSEVPSASPLTQLANKLFDFVTTTKSEQIFGLNNDFSYDSSAEPITNSTIRQSKVASTINPNLTSSKESLNVVNKSDSPTSNRPELTVSKDVNSNAQLSISDDTSYNELSTNNKLSSTAPQKDFISSILNSEEKENLTSLLRTFGIENEPAATTSLNKTNNELLQELKDLLPHLSKADLKSLLSSDEVKKLLQEGLKDKWSLSPSQLSDYAKEQTEHPLDKHIHQMLEQASELTSIIKGDTTTSTQLQSTKQFMTQFQGMFDYLPLPLKLSAQNASGELYVYRKKQAATSSKNGITVLLHLDMDNLGKTDIHIEQNDNTLRNKFYFEDDTTIEFIESSIYELESILEKKGYQVTNQVILRDDTTTPIKEVLEQEEDLAKVTRYNFDLRA